MKKQTLLLLGVIQSLGPFTFDTYIAAMPQMETELRSSAAGIQMTISINLIGMIIGMFLAGPYSDSKGRRKLLLWAIFGYFVASVNISIATDLTLVMPMRFLQGFSAAAAMTVVMAIVRDSAAGETAAKIYSSMMIVKSVAPIIAPAIGGVILLVANWRGIFMFLALTAAVILVWAYFGISETLHESKRIRFNPVGVTRGWVNAFTDKQFIAGLLGGAFMTAGLFGYLSTGSFAAHEDFGLTAEEFSVLLVFNGFWLLLASYINKALIKKYKTVKSYRIGMTVTLGAAAALVTSALNPTSFLLFEVGMLLCFAAVGFIMPTSTAVAMQNQDKTAGTAAGLMGLITSAFGALAIFIITIAVGTSSAALALFIAAVYVISASSLLLLSPARKKDSV